jgi:hypothetical protein
VCNWEIDDGVEFGRRKCRKALTAKTAIVSAEDKPNGFVVNDLFFCKDQLFRR